MEKITLRCSQKFFPHINLHDSTHFHISPHSHHNFMTFIAQTFTSEHVSLNTLHISTHFTKQFQNRLTTSIISLIQLSFEHPFFHIHIFYHSITNTIIPSLHATFYHDHRFIFTHSIINKIALIEYLLSTFTSHEHTHIIYKHLNPIQITFTQTCTQHSHNSTQQPFLNTSYQHTHNTQHFWLQYCKKILYKNLS